MHWDTVVWCGERRMEESGKEWSEAKNMLHVWLQQCTAYNDSVVVDYTKWVIYSNRAIKCEQNDIWYMW